MKVYVHSHQKKRRGNHPLAFDDLAEVVKEQSVSEILRSGPQLNNLDKADLYVIEVSSPSIQAGYVVAYAVNVRRPVLCLFHDSVDKESVQYLSEGVSRKLIKLASYNTDNIEEVLFSFFRQKRKKEIVTTKFTLRVPPSVVEYLNWKQKTSHKSKAALLRDGFVEEVMAKDERYQDYLREKGED